MFKNRCRASMILIFLFTCGVLGIIVTGIYFMVANAAQVESFLQRESQKRMVEQAAERVVLGVLENASKTFINASADVTAGGYNQASRQTDISTALTWGLQTALPNGYATVSNLALTLPDITSAPSTGHPPFDKSNAPAYGNYMLTHPLWRFAGYDNLASVTSTLTPTNTGAPFSFSRNYAFYREIPMGQIPLTAAYTFGGFNTCYGSSVWTTGIETVGLLAKGPGGSYPSFIKTAAGTLNVPASLKKWTYPYLYSTFGVDPLAICGYSTTAANNAELKQIYSLDPSCIVLSFDGSVVNVLAAPVGGTSVPAAITVAAYDGRNRCIVDLSTLPTTGNYANKKWYVHCTTDAAKAAGIVLKDTGASSAVATGSVTTDGFLYLWSLTNSANRTPMVAGTNYGGVGLADSNYSGTGTTTSPMKLNWKGYLSAYGKETVAVSDTFAGAASLNGRTPAPTSAGANWSVTAGSINCNSGNISSTGSTVDAYIALPTTVSGSAGITVSFTVSLTGSGDRLAKIFLANSAPCDALNNFEFDAKVSAGGATTVSAVSTVGGVSSTTSAGVSGNPTTFLVEMTLVPAVGEMFIKAGPTSVVPLVEAKLGSMPSWIPTYVGVELAPGATGTTTVRAFQIRTMAYGTLFTSPHFNQSAAYTANFYGGVGIGENLGWLLHDTGALNFVGQKSVSNATNNYCERILVHYPYVSKP